MAIVEEFCAVSGARLNLPKCKTLVLNGHLDPGDIDDSGLLRMLGPGVPVSYLGVQFGKTYPQHTKSELSKPVFWRASNNGGAEHGRSKVVGCS
jgi:hypothetical protein